MRISYLPRFAALLTGFLVLPQANALPVTFGFSGTCDAACKYIGLGTGAAVGGGLVTTEASLADGLLTGGEIDNFWLNFGLLSLDSSNSEIATTFLALSDDGQTFSDGLFRIEGIFGLLPGPNLDFFALEWLDQWRFVLPPLLDPTNDPRGSGSFTRVTSVPEPATLSLLGAGLLAIGLAGRRRRKS